MAILIKPVQKVNPQNREEKKWYVTQVTTAQVDETTVAMDLADETTLNASEAMMAIRPLVGMFFIPTSFYSCGCFHPQTQNVFFHADIGSGGIKNPRKGRKDSNPLALRKK